MELDPLEPKTKDPNMRSFTLTPITTEGRAMTAAGIKFEFAEYLKGHTHYIVVTIKKARDAAEMRPRWSRDRRRRA